MSEAKRPNGAARLSSRRKAAFVDNLSTVPLLDAFWLAQGKRTESEAVVAYQTIGGLNDVEVVDAGAGPFGAIAVRCVLN